MKIKNLKSILIKENQKSVISIDGGQCIKGGGRARPVATTSSVNWG